MKFKEMRLSSGMTQSEVAEKLGIERSTVAMWESEKSKPRADMLLKVAGLFGCTIDELLRE